MPGAVLVSGAGEPMAGTTATFGVSADSIGSNSVLQARTGAPYLAWVSLPSAPWSPR